MDDVLIQRQTLTLNTLRRPSPHFQRAINLKYDLGEQNVDTAAPWRTSTAIGYRSTYYPRTRFRAQLVRLSRWLSDRAAARRQVAASW